MLVANEFLYGLMVIRIRPSVIIVPRRKSKKKLQGRSPVQGAASTRSCRVSFTDSEGIEHSVQVPAASLYEAAVEAMAAFRRSVLVEMPLGSATQLTIRVKAPEEERTITIGKVLAWLGGVAMSPGEKLKKSRLKERLSRSFRQQ